MNKIENTELESIAKGLVDANKYDPANPADVARYEADMESARKAATLIQHQKEQATDESAKAAERRRSELISLGRQSLSKVPFNGFSDEDFLEEGERIERWARDMSSR